MSVRAWMVLSVLTLGVGCDGKDDEGYMDDDPPSGSCVTDGSTDTDGCPDTDASTGGASGDTTTGAGATTGDASTTTTTTTGASGGGGDGGDACKSSADCPGDQVCVADFVGDKRGPFRCEEVCIGIMNEAMWCADAAACCSGTASCTDRGYCVEEGAP